MNAFDIGSTIDGFRNCGRVHVGGMAVLYRVESERQGGLPLIMKVPRMAQGDDAVSVVSYEVEQMMLGVLKGPHVPRLIAAGDLERLPYIVMEFIEGATLAERAAQAPLPAAQIACLMAPVANAVHDLHGQQFVHHDLKPANIMFRAEGSVVLIDLGLGHHAQLPDLLAEDCRKAVGSAPYIAPEQVVGVRCDPRSDIFALGVILYELATGRLPFGKPASTAGLRQRLYRKPLPPRAIRPDVPEWLQEVILRCLEVNADQRYATAAQLAMDLAHPEQVIIGERGRQQHRQTLGNRLALWFRAAGWEPAPCPSPLERIAAAPIVQVAVATRYHQPELSAELQRTVRRIASLDGDYRIAVVTVMPVPPLLGGSQADDSAAAQHLRNLVQLRHWAEPLRLPAGRVSYHVLEHDDPALALLHFARVNQVDQLVIGAPPVVDIGLGRQALSGSIAAKVMLDAPCTVTLVRSRGSAV